MANQVVMVTATVTGTEITWDFDALVVELNPGDTLSWQFDGVPSDCVPGILFDSNAGFGPFQALELKGNLVIGRGNNGQTGTYTYSAQLLDASGIRSTSTQTVSVLNQVPDLERSPTAVIPCHIHPETKAVSMEKIDDLKLFSGDTAIWLVTGLTAEFFVSFRFLLTSGDLATGPFESLVFNRELEGLRVIGQGFSLPETSTQLTYHVEVRDASGTVRASDDPTIDNLGQPPG